jgi:hypothetical protein
MVLLAMAFLPLCVEAQVYRWVDENGKVHYGDRPVAKEVSRVRGLIDPTAADPLPKPGMKAADVRAAYGEPERVRKVSTRSGETEIWAYRKSKRIRQDFVVKIEGGEVAEVATDTATEAVQPTVASNVQGTARTAADAEYRQQQALAQQETEQREQRCIGLRESLQRIDSQERRGGSAAAMDSLREQKRQAGERLSAQGC